MSDRPSPAYRVLPEDEQFRVAGNKGRTIMVCRDEPSATHYVVLLNEAFQHGYRAGYRDGKNVATDPR